MINLRSRNEAMFYFGLICLVSAVIFLCLTRLSQLQVNGTNAWYKPFKFALSIGFFCWTMGWLTYDLHLPVQITIYNWLTILLLSFELIYIALQASRGELSHFNRSTPLYSVMYTGMAIAASFVTLHTAYIGILFCTRTFPQLPDYYVWAVRMGIFLFVIFAFEGAAMGGRNAHTVGAADGGEGLRFLNWSRKYGDLRIAHFVGMHAIQVLPLLSFYFIKDVKLTLLLGVAYTALALFVLVQALNGRPLFR